MEIFGTMSMTLPLCFPTQLKAGSFK